MNQLDSHFFERNDVTLIAKELLGMKICTQVDESLTCGIITETEAYGGATDKAAHSYNNRRTPRTEVMFGPAGRTYIYLCYGLHHMLNIVTNQPDQPEAVLIRAIQPTDGIETMLSRRGKQALTPSLTSGPGSVAKALGLTLQHNNEPIGGEAVWIESIAYQQPLKIAAAPRVGIDYAEEDKDRPWRFILQSS